MSQDPNNISTDLRGAARLAIDGIVGIADIVESLHSTIVGAASVRGTTDKPRTSGITGMVYRNVRTVTELVGSGIDAPLNRLGSILGNTESSSRREAILAALNGVLGDHLVARNNPLAIPLRLRRAGKSLNEQSLAELIAQSSGKLAIMVHGLCMNDLQWNRQGHDHGVALAHDLGLLPIYVHYNSGLHVSENGRNLADLLETVSDQAPQPIELFIVGHSMGGLVARSAFHYGKLAGHTWPDQLRKLVFLGTPHHGALLEKGGNWIDILLEANAYTAPFARLGKIRSCGVTDLRYGNVVDEDWVGRDQFEYSGDQRVPVPLPEAVDCYAAAATIGKDANKLAGDLIGDGLVTVRSALGLHTDAALSLLLPEEQQWVGYEMNHIDLLNRPEVYETIKKWLEA